VPRHEEVSLTLGRHVRPWPERPIFGTVRSMTLAGLRRKLDLDGYIASIDRAVV
jgi:deoxyribodipyrimidine photo-lyase